MSATIEGTERRLDDMAREALRREGERLAREHLDAGELARRMATARCVIRAWRSRATGAVLREAATPGASR